MGLFNIAAVWERHSRGLLAALPPADLGILVSGAVVFGAIKLTPAQDNSWLRRELKLPKWMPPNWVFPAVWIPLKLMQSVAAWVVYKKAATTQDLILPLGLFVAHLALGGIWNVVFFNQKRIQESRSYMAAFWLSIAGTIASFSAVSPAAAMLMVPTQIWVTIAAKLNWDIASLNRKAD